MPTKSKSAALATANRNKAMSHPLRAKVLLLLGEEPGSPADIAGRLERDDYPTDLSRSDLTSEITYHCKYLMSLGCAEEIDGSKPGLGNLVKRVYRAIEPHLVNTEDWEALPPEAKDSNSRQFAQTQIDNLVDWLKHGGGFNRFFHVTSDRYWLDQEGLENSMEIMKEAMVRLEDEAAAAEGRLAESKERGTRVASMLSCVKVGPYR